MPMLQVRPSSETSINGLFTTSANLDKLGCSPLSLTIFDAEQTNGGFNSVRARARKSIRPHEAKAGSEDLLAFDHWHPGSWLSAAPRRRSRAMDFSRLHRQREVSADSNRHGRRL